MSVTVTMRVAIHNPYECSLLFSQTLDEPTPKSKIVLDTYVAYHYGRLTRIKSSQLPDGSGTAVVKFIGDFPGTDWSFEELFGSRLLSVRTALMSRARKLAPNKALLNRPIESTFQISSREFKHIKTAVKNHARNFDHQFYVLLRGHEFLTTDPSYAPAT